MPSFVFKSSDQQYELPDLFPEQIQLETSGLDINLCPVPVKTDVGQVDLVLWLSDGTSEKIRFPNVLVR